MKERIFIYFGILALGILAVVTFVRIPQPAPAPNANQSNRDVEDFFARFDTARELRANGSFAEAEKALLELIEAYGDNPAVANHIIQPRFDLAAVYRAHNLHEEAQKQYETIIAMGNSTNVIRAKLALADMRPDGNRLKTLRELYAEFGHEPETGADVAAKLARMLIDEGDCAEAADLVSETLRSRLTNSMFLLNELRDLQSIGLREQAAEAPTRLQAGEIYERHAEKFPDMKDYAWLWLEQAGLLYQEAGEFHRARRVFYEIVRDHPGDADSHVGVALNLAERLARAENEAATPLTSAGVARRVESGEKLVVVNENINRTAAWTPDSGTYVVDGEIEIGGDGELTIEAGTTIIFTLRSSLTTSGRLYVNGTAEAPVIFTTAADKSTDFDWDGLQFKNSSGSRITGAVIRYARRGIVCENSSADFADVLVESCGFAGIEALNSTINVARCRFAGNGYGIKFDGSEATVEGGEITASVYDGVEIRQHSDVALRNILIARNHADGIVCLVDIKAVIENVTCEDNTDTGLRAIGSAPAITASSFARNETGLMAQSGANPAIKNCTFQSNSIGVHSRIASSPTIDGCLFDGNTEYGIVCETRSSPAITGNRFANLIGPAIHVLDLSQPVVRGNHFPAEGTAVQHDGIKEVDLSENHFGSQE